jgi:hypothetical protein
MKYWSTTGHNLLNCNMIISHDVSYSCADILRYFYGLGAQGNLCIMNISDPLCVPTCFIIIPDSFNYQQRHLLVKQDKFGKKMAVLDMVHKKG